MIKLHHICIQTSSYKTSLDFYMDILGFKLIKETKGFHGRDYNSWLDLNGFKLELQTNKSDQILNRYNKDNQGISHMCFATNELQNEFNKIKQLGYNNFKIKNGKEIYSVEGGFLFKVIAPEGTIIEFRDSVNI